MNKRLYRSRTDTFLSGVCGGIADYFNFDVSLVRIAWVIATLATGGLGLIAYIIAAVVVPLEPIGGVEGMGTEKTNAGESEFTSQDKTTQGTQDSCCSSDYRSCTNGSGITRKYIGLFLIIFGVFFMVKRFIPAIDFGMLWAICLVLVGIGLMVKRG